MKIDIPGVSLIHQNGFSDNRGSFLPVWEKESAPFCMIDFSPSSLNMSRNPQQHTLRGMHFQSSPFEQSKIVSCIQGEILDVIIDLRKESSCFGEWQMYTLNAEGNLSLYIPKGCAHGYLTLLDNTIVAYAIEGEYKNDFSRTLNWRDPAIGIDWPDVDPLISDRDRNAPYFSELCEYL